MMRKTQNGMSIVDCELCTASVGLQPEHIAHSVLGLNETMAALKWTKVGPEQWLCSDKKCGEAFRVGKAFVERAYRSEKG